MSKKPSITIGTPHRRDFTPEYVSSLALTLLDGRYDYSCLFQEGPVIHYNRNIIGQLCRADFLLFVDTDIIWQPDDISKLVEADKDITAGLYFSRGDPPFSVFIPKSPNDVVNIPETPFELLSAGAGFMLIKKGVLDAFFSSKIWPFDPLCWDHEGFSSDFYGEDYSFCDKARQLGFEVWCVPGASIGHVGTRAFMPKPAADSWIASVAKMGCGI